MFAFRDHAVHERQILAQLVYAIHTQQLTIARNKDRLIVAKEYGVAMSLQCNRIAARRMKKGHSEERPFWSSGRRNYAE